MKILKVEIDGKELILNVKNIKYTVGNIVTVIDISFDIDSVEMLSMLRIIIYNENIDIFLSKISSNEFIDLNTLGDVIESMQDFYLVQGLVSKENKDKVYSFLDIGAESNLLDWSDTLSKTNEDLSNYNEDFFKSEIDYMEIENE